jgi:hypothetical protein
MHKISHRISKLTQFSLVFLVKKVRAEYKSKGANFNQKMDSNLARSIKTFRAKQKFKLLDAAP